VRKAVWCLSLCAKNRPSVLASRIRAALKEATACWQRLPGCSRKQKALDSEARSRSERLDHLRLQQCTCCESSGERPLQTRPEVQRLGKYNCQCSCAWLPTSSEQKSRHADHLLATSICRNQIFKIFLCASRMHRNTLQASQRSERRRNTALQWKPIWPQACWKGHAAFSVPTLPRSPSSVQREA